MRPYALLFLINTLVVAAPRFLYSQDTQISSLHETGRFYIQNFGYKEYDAHQQNWGIVQDKRGIVYIGNNWGILEYDGVSWRHIVTDKNSAVIAMDIDSTDTIYVGAEQGLGYLAPDSVGFMQFVSLEAFISETARDFADVWRVHATRHGVYFFTVNRLLLWTNGQFKSWVIKAHSYSQALGNTVYYADPDSGLMQVSGGAPVKVPSGETFKDKRVSTIFQFNEKGKLLVGTRADGLFLYDGTAFEPFETEADSFFKEKMIYSGTSLQDGGFAFGTIRGGVAIINKRGKWLHKLDKTNGLRDQTIISCFQDSQGGLWLSFLNGIARVELTTPFSRFNSENGLEGGVESICRHSGILYAATHSGVFYLDSQLSAHDENVSFKRVTGIEGFAWELFSDNRTLLAATDEGVFEIHNKEASQVETASMRSFTFYQPVNSEEYLLLGLIDGLAVLKKGEQGLKNLGRVKGIDVEIRSITGDGNGRFWLGTNVNGAILIEKLDLVHPPQNSFFDAKVTTFAEKQLPVGEVNVFNIGDRVLFGTERGIRFFDTENQAFRLDSTYGNVFADTVRYIGRIVEDQDKRVWIFSRKNKRRMFGYAEPLVGGNYKWQPTPFQRIRDVGIVFSVYPEADGTTWIGGTEGIARYQPEASTASQNFHAAIRRVIVKEDSVVFGGKYSENSKGSATFPHNLNAIRFEYTGSSYNAVSENRYQFKLEGFEENWSSWTDELKKDYTNLHEGIYRFKVRAKNVYGAVSREDSFRFQILAPWYRSWSAYLFYVLTFIFALFQLNRMQIKRQQQKAFELLEREKEKASLLEAQLRAEAAELQAKATEAEKEVEKEQIRSRIASDLHDEIGSNLSSISIISQMLLKKSKLNQGEKKRIGDINVVARLSAESMRDIIWFVNPVNDSMQKLVARMRDTANVMLEHIEFKFSSAAEISRLTTELELRRNLYLVYKEALQNIIKHAEAENVEISVDYEPEDKSLRLLISDDGIGFETVGNMQGDGLKNFTKRTNAVGGSLTVKSKPAKGTTITLNVKIP